MWMKLKYPGTCKVCGVSIDKGTTAFYDRPTRSVTCWNIDCCKADNLTSRKWVGSPVSGKWIDDRADRRIGKPYQG